MPRRKGAWICRNAKYFIGKECRRANSPEAEFCRMCGKNRYSDLVDVGVTDWYKEEMRK